MAKLRSVDLTNPFLDPLENVCELLLVRHGEQHYYRGMSLAEATNPPLSELGEQLAAAVGRRLADHTIDAVYISPLRRAADTGHAIAQHHSLEAIALEGLHEVDLWGQLRQDVPLTDAISREELTAIFREAQRSQRWDAYVYGEAAEGFRKRVFDAIEDIAARHAGDRVVIACHGGVIGTYLSQLWSANVDQPVHVHHTSITTVRAMDHHRRVIAVNDFAHVLDFQSSLNELNAQ